VTEGLMADPTG